MTEQDPSATPEGEPIVPPPDTSAGDGPRDDVPEASSTSRRSFVAAFSALGLSGFRLLFAGAAATPARADQTYPCATGLPNGDTVADTHCATPTATTGVHSDLDCGLPTNEPPGFMKDNDCGLADPVGNAVWKDDACGYSTPTGAEADEDCDQALAGGGFHSDQDCNTFESGTGVAKNADNDCSGFSSGSPSGSDADCGSRSSTAGVHSDDDCTGTRQQSDQDCGLGPNTDSDCGTGSGSVSNDDDCQPNNVSTPDKDCAATGPGGGAASQDNACSGPGADGDCGLPNGPSTLHTDGP